jgi:hypothetical protein
MPLLPIPIDFVEQTNPFAVTINPVASGLVQLTPIFKQFVKQILALFAILITASTVSARRFSFAFATSTHSLSFWLLF